MFGRFNRWTLCAMVLLTTALVAPPATATALEISTDAVVGNHHSSGGTYGNWWLDAHWELDSASVMVMIDSSYPKTTNAIDTTSCWVNSWPIDCSTTTDSAVDTPGTPESLVIARNFNGNNRMFVGTVWGFGNESGNENEPAGARNQSVANVFDGLRELPSLEFLEIVKNP